MCASEFQAVQEAMAKNTDVNDKVLEAMAVLSERLERIKSLGGGFAKIGFSTDAANLLKTKIMASVG